jgi:hypothetical protein
VRAVPSLYPTSENIIIIIIIMLIPTYFTLVMVLPVIKIPVVFTEDVYILLFSLLHVNLDFC